MKIKELSDILVEITSGDSVARIERGPQRKRAKATDELLSDEVTATHYAVGKPDALNKPIEKGKDMDYIDWKAPKSEHVWYVYLLEDGRFQPKSNHANRDDAMSAATELL